MNNIGFAVVFLAITLALNIPNILSKVPNPVESTSPVLNLCANHGGLGQSQGVGNGPFQKLGYECKDGFGGKVGIR